MAVAKFLALISGRTKEVPAVDASAGAGDAGKVVALNASGILADSILNAGATGGAGDANKTCKLDANGKITEAMLPSGVGAETYVVQASENLAANDYVNIYSDTGAFRCRKADATTEGKEAHGFVKANVTSGQNATIYEGTNSGLTGQTPGRVYLSTTAGLGTATPPSASGNVVQCIGFATSATTVNFQYSEPITVA